MIYSLICLLVCVFFLTSLCFVLKQQRKRKQKLLKTFCLDGKEFIKKVVKEEAYDSAGKYRPVKHVIMNLPMIAPSFLCKPI